MNSSTCVLQSEVIPIWNLRKNAYYESLQWEFDLFTKGAGKASKGFSDRNLKKNQVAMKVATVNVKKGRTYCSYLFFLLIDSW